MNGYVVVVVGDLGFCVGGDIAWWMEALSWGSLANQGRGVLLWVSSLGVCAFLAIDGQLNSK